MDTATELFGLAGKVALVTGAGNGIARATALNFATVGCQVVVVDIDAKAATETAEEIRRGGGDALVVSADLTDHEAPRRMVAAAVAEFGGLDVAVNVCGGTGGVNTPLLDMTPAEFTVPMELNLMSTFLSTQAEAIAMIRGDRPGAIVNVASTAGVQGSPRLAGYGAANAGVIHLTKTAALELAEYGVRVNCVVPASHWTKGTRARAADPETGAAMRKFFDGAARATPMGRLGEAEDTAGVTLFLASELSSYLTGQAVASDGGLLAGSNRGIVGGHQVPEAIRDVVADK